MSYTVGFNGFFVYENEDSMAAALAIIDQESDNPDSDEPNGLEKSDFKVDAENCTLVIHYDASMPSSTWYGCRRLLCKMSGTAVEGEMRCSFEGDPDEWINAGYGWD